MLDAFRYLETGRKRDLPPHSQTKRKHMLKDLVSKLDYSNFEEIALVIFGVCFLAIVWGASRLKKDAAARFSHIPIEDAVVDPWQGVKK